MGLLARFAKWWEDVPENEPFREHKTPEPENKWTELRIDDEKSLYIRSDGVAVVSSINAGRYLASVNSEIECGLDELPLPVSAVDQYRLDCGFGWNPRRVSLGDGEYITEDYCSKLELREKIATHLVLKASSYLKGKIKFQVPFEEMETFYNETVLLKVKGNTGLYFNKFDRCFIGPYEEYPKDFKAYIESVYNAGHENKVDSFSYEDFENIEDLLHADRYKSEGSLDLYVKFPDGTVVQMSPEWYLTKHGYIDSLLQRYVTKVLCVGDFWIPSVIVAPPEGVYSEEEELIIRQNEVPGICRSGRASVPGDKKSMRTNRVSKFQEVAIDE